MLGKLLKNEMKATRRVFLPLFALLILFACVGALFGHSGYTTYDSGVPEIVANLSTMLYVMIVFGSIIVTVIALVQRFYKHLLGDEGYLMFTLPVPSWQHIVTKGLLAIFWVTVSAVVGLFSVTIITRTVGEIPAFLGDAIHEFQSLAQNDFGIPSFVLVLEIILIALVAMASSLLMVYAAIAIGHLWTEHRLLGSIFGFLGLQIIINTLTSIFGLIVGRFSPTLFNLFRWNQGSASVGSNNVVLLLIMLFYFAISAGLFFLTNFVLSKKLNLE